jgi:cell division protein FtsB
MTQNEASVIDKHLRGINLRVIWALIICTAVSTSSVLSVYYGLKTDIAIQKVELKLLEKRIDYIEKR